LYLVWIIMFIMIKYKPKKKEKQGKDEEEKQIEDKEDKQIEGKEDKQIEDKEETDQL